MRQIWKFSIPILGEPCEIEMPLDARIVHVGAQDLDTLMFWAEVDRVATFPRTFRVFGTGHLIDTGWEYRGTVQVGVFVWHLYEQAVPS